jgi:hypothetical protein
MKDTRWCMKPNTAKVIMLAKRQLEFNQLMLGFYETGDQRQMNAFLRSCLDERMIKIMKEE